ncbi:hypothetical protein ABW636_07385 [Aquimarina sp. 2201CG1-2-11]|uniref:hypothetical protein n=1 Tax=Aquimarina discodermiae TaxID=3231043 RepID=UPI003462B1B2
MEKFVEGSKNGELPVIFLYTMLENQENNHELKKRDFFVSEKLCSSGLVPNLEDRYDII